MQGDFSPGVRDVDDHKFKTMLLVPLRLALPATLPQTEYYWHWRKAVHEYTGRVLTSNYDRYMGLFDITAKFCSVLGDECVLRIWGNGALRVSARSVDTVKCETTPISDGWMTGPSWS